MSVQVFVTPIFLFILNLYLEVGFLGHVIYFMLNFTEKRNTKKKADKWFS